jgi:hypothetical protein
MKPNPPTRHVAVFLDEAIVARVDALIPGLSTPWNKATRASALRSLVLLGLDKTENDRETAPVPRLRRSAR